MRKAIDEKPIRLFSDDQVWRGTLSSVPGIDATDARLLLALSRTPGPR